MNKVASVLFNVFSAVVFGLANAFITYQLMILIRNDFNVFFLFIFPTILSWIETKLFIKKDKWAYFALFFILSFVFTILYYI